jgi:hypothetical protein
VYPVPGYVDRYRIRYLNFATDAIELRRARDPEIALSTLISRFLIFQDRIPVLQIQLKLKMKKRKKNVRRRDSNPASSGVWSTLDH